MKEKNIKTIWIIISSLVALSMIAALILPSIQ